MVGINDIEKSGFVGRVFTSYAWGGGGGGGGGGWGMILFVVAGEVFWPPVKSLHHFVVLLNSMAMLHLPQPVRSS